MIEVFLKTVPFFAVLACGYGAARVGFFTKEATAYLTKFVFYFALSAMIFRFSATLPLAEVFDAQSVLAYLLATTAVYFLAVAVAMIRKVGLEEAAIEGQCAAIGNVGFLGIPMLVMLIGPEAVGPVMIVLATDLVVFGSLFVIIVSAKRDGRVSVKVLGSVVLGLVKNPMVMSIAAGLIWAGTATPIPQPMEAFLGLLGSAATPGALFAIGASLAGKSTERAGVAVWLSTAKLGLHPLAVAAAALFVFAIDPFTASVMIAAAAMPTAGNVFILAQHYEIAPVRVSTTILFSTVVSVVSLTAVLAMVLK